MICFSPLTDEETAGNFLFVLIGRSSCVRRSLTLKTRMEMDRVSPSRVIPKFLIFFFFFPHPFCSFFFGVFSWKPTEKNLCVEIVCASKVASYPAISWAPCQYACCDKTLRISRLAYLTSTSHDVKILCLFYLIFCSFK